MVLTDGDWESLQAKACSRPPLPTRRIVNGSDIIKTVKCVYYLKKSKMLGKEDMKYLTFRKNLKRKREKS